MAMETFGSFDTFSAVRRRIHDVLESQLRMQADDLRRNSRKRKNPDETMFTM
jgi:hypothetical protein